TRTHAVEFAAEVVGLADRGIKLVLYPFESEPLSNERHESGRALYAALGCRRRRRSYRCRTGRVVPCPRSASRGAGVRCHTVVGTGAAGTVVAQLRHRVL